MITTCFCRKVVSLFSSLFVIGALLQACGSSSGSSPPSSNSPIKIPITAEDVITELKAITTIDSTFYRKSTTGTFTGGQGAKFSLDISGPHSHQKSYTISSLEKTAIDQVYLLDFEEPGVGLSFPHGMGFAFKDFFPDSGMNAYELGIAGVVGQFFAFRSDDKQEKSYTFGDINAPSSMISKGYTAPSESKSSSSIQPHDDVRFSINLSHKNAGGVHELRAVVTDWHVKNKVEENNKKHLSSVDYTDAFHEFNKNEPDDAALLIEFTFKDAGTSPFIHSSSELRMGLYGDSLAKSYLAGTYFLETKVVAEMEVGNLSESQIYWGVFLLNQIP